LVVVVDRVEQPVLLEVLLQTVQLLAEVPVDYMVVVVEVVMRQGPVVEQVVVVVERWLISITIQ
jgi:hypothetical protein